MKLPGIERFLRPQRHFIEYFSRLVIYNCMNTLACLAGTGIGCPPFPTYAPVLVRFIQEHGAPKVADHGREAEPEEDAFT